MLAALGPPNESSDDAPNAWPTMRSWPRALMRMPLEMQSKPQVTMHTMVPNP